MAGAAPAIAGNCNMSHLLVLVLAWGVLDCGEEGGALKKQRGKVEESISAARGILLPST